MILDLHGQTLIRRIERGPFGHRPGFQYAFHLQPEVVVQACRIVLLDHEAIALLFLHFWRRFGRVFESAFSLIFFERHSCLSERHSSKPNGQLAYDVHLRWWQAAAIMAGLDLQSEWLGFTEK